ncbi:MAG: ComEC/Rec2 family competence protein [Candidatus Paceibacterota bacterium]
MTEVNHVERLRSNHQELNAQIDVLNGCPGVKSEEVVLSNALNSVSETGLRGLKHKPLESELCYNAGMGDPRTGVSVFYSLASSFAFGIFLRSFFSLGLVEVVWLMLLAVAIALLWRQADVSDLRIWLLYGAVIFVGSAAGILRLEIASWSEVLPQYETRLGEAFAVTGTIVREPDEREQLTHLYVKVEDELLLVTTDRFQQFSYGDVVTVSGTLEKPEAFMTDLGRTFNYPGYLRARGVNYVLPFSDVEVIEQGAGNIILTKLFAFKRTFMDALEQVVEEPMVGLGEGLLLGVKRALGSELETVFRQTGIIHIVVLSGYNVMLVVAFVMYLLGSLLPRRWQVGFGIVAITLFALLVGLGATVVRASLMAGILLVLSLTGRTYFVIRALVLAGVIMLIVNPYLLAFDVGFQLSFMATLGLILLAPAIIARITWLPDWFGAREFLAATVATQIFVAPILLYQIGEFSLIAVIVNVLVLRWCR